jgi:DNA-binding transcriptional regulator GbsR (MarR family)
MKITPKKTEKSKAYSLILFTLAERPLDIAGLSRKLGKSRSVVSNQMKILKMDGFVKQDKNKKYKINWDKILSLLEKHMEKTLKALEPAMKFTPRTPREKRLLSDFVKIKEEFSGLEKQVKKSRSIEDMLKWTFSYWSKAGYGYTIDGSIRGFGIFLGSKYKLTRTIFHTYGEDELRKKLVKFFGLTGRLMALKKPKPRTR